MILTKEKAKELFFDLKVYLDYCKKIDKLGLPKLHQSKAYKTTYTAKITNLCEQRDFYEKEFLNNLK